MSAKPGNRIRVAIIQESIDARRGGAETSVLEMAAALATEGAEPTIIFNAGADGETQPPPADRVNFRGLTPPSRLTRAGRARWYVTATSDFLEHSRFDIVHAVTPHPLADIYQPRGGLLAETIERSIARAGSPLSRLVKRAGRFFHAKQRYLDQLERSLFEAPHSMLPGSPPLLPLVAAVSEYVRRQIIERHPSMAERVRVVFNGVNVERLRCDDAAALRASTRQKLGLNAAERVVLFVAHNFKLKGLPELIRAVAMSQPHGPAAWTLLVAGRDNPVRYERLVATLGIRHLVRFIGTDHEIRSLYAAADVLAHPTWYDPCSRVVLEALCCGMPVVTTRWNGAAEAMTPGRHGAVIDSPSDITALAAGIAATLQSDIRAACAADAAGFCERLSMRRHARELMEQYQPVLNSRRQ